MARQLIHEARRLMSLLEGDEKHLASALSTLEIISTLFDCVLVRDSAKGDTDEFYMSRGHGPMGFYAVLAAIGEIELSDLLEFGSFHGRLGHHPDRSKVPAFGISSGSLGHGVGLAAGTAIAKRISGDTGRIFVLVGDGEMDEGSIWEGIVFAGRAGLSNLRMIVADNHSSTLGWPGGLEMRLAAEGWITDRVSRADLDVLCRALSVDTDVAPAAIIVDIDDSGELR